MIRFQSRLPFRSPLFAFGLLLLLSTLSILAISTARSDELGHKAKDIAPTDNSAQLENTVTCSLQEGHTEFVISVPKTTDRLTFLNENATAAGELTISVSNRRLPANSPEWTRVEGTIAFSHKRTFDLSLLGIDAKFVKVTFRVARRENIALNGAAGIGFALAVADSH